jgi:hypothetical protein
VREWERDKEEVWEVEEEKVVDGFYWRCGGRD